MSRLAVTVAAAFLIAPSVAAQSTWPGYGQRAQESCVPMSGDAASWLARADSAMGVPQLGNRILAFRAVDTYQAMEQSDRVYAPFLTSHTDQAWWYDPKSGAERWGPTIPPATGSARSRDWLRDAGSTVRMRDSVLVAANLQLATFYASTRALNPMAAVSDFRRAGDARVVERCSYRDYPRVVLSRSGGERLYLDLKTAYPVKLEREEPHYIWGQVKAEYIYTSWSEAGPATLPVAAIRTIDGVEEWRRMLPGAAIARANAVPRDSTPPMPALPAVSAPAADKTLPAYVVAGAVDTVRVSPHTFLLTHPTYQHAVTLVGDTVYLFDASTGEWRSRADSTWIAKLFPGKHPVVLVVTDIAWPHVSGVRFWVARGATVLTHTLSKPFLDQVIGRRWTRTPDALELVRATVHPVIRTTSSALALAGGAVRVAPIDGIASEGALIGFLAADKFLWASDYIQILQAPSQYAREVRDAVHRAGFAPTQVAAEHLRLTPWTTVDSLLTHP